MILDLNHRRVIQHRAEINIDFAGLQRTVVGIIRRAVNLEIDLRMRGDETGQKIIREVDQQTRRIAQRQRLRTFVFHGLQISDDVVVHL